MKKLIFIALPFLTLSISNCGKETEKIIEKQITNEVFTGEGDPLPTIGKPGDYYFDRQNGKFYGPKTSQGWGTPSSVLNTPRQGQDPNTKTITGTTPPTAEQGSVGDWYIDTQARKIYGPKTTEGWGRPSDLQDGQANKPDQPIKPQPTPSPTPQPSPSPTPQPTPEPSPIPAPNPTPEPRGTSIDPSFYELSEDGRILMRWKGGKNLDMITDEKLRYVTEIAPRAFMRSGISSIILSKDLISIGEYAFAGN